MSTFVNLELTCNHCHGRFQVEAAQSLQIRRFPEYREQILDGVFNHFRCPHCERLAVVEPRLLYTDFERFHWLVAWPGHALRYRAALGEKMAASFHKNMVVSCPPLVRSWAPRFTRRMVFGLPQLREKLLIFDHELDDRLIEALKLRILQSGRWGKLSIHSSLLFEGMEGVGLRFRYTGPQGPDRMAVSLRFTVNAYRYTELAERRPHLEQQMPELFGGLTVDWRGALLPPAPLPPEEYAAL
ncbi:MAG: CpXC domain-containing protein [Myxococcota bacterium]